ncbi:MAG: hypothetical protein LBQ37_02660 [Elusimicrobiota bacterium]|jgi:hypothetical protein|nr:hypothetical protein [Elusimicrobiota bacterium]
MKEQVIETKVEKGLEDVIEIREKDCIAWECLKDSILKVEWNKEFKEKIIDNLISEIQGTIALMRVIKVTRE